MACYRIALDNRKARELREKTAFEEVKQKLAETESNFWEMAKIAAKAIEERDEALAKLRATHVD